MAATETSVGMPKEGACLADALAAVQSDLPHIEKSERADVATKQGTYSYTYAGLASITDKVMPLLAKHGLSFLAKTTFSGDRFVLAASLLHTSGEREDAEYPLPTSGTPQAIGSAITYGRRYLLCAMTGVAPEDDDDGAAAEAEQQSRRGTAQRAATTRRPPAGRAAGNGERTAARKSAPAGPPPLPGEENLDADRITQPQLTKLAILARELELRDDKAAYLGYLSRVAGRDVESSKSLSKAEARRVIEAMEGDKVSLAEAASAVDDQPTEDESS